MSAPAPGRPGVMHRLMLAHDPTAMQGWQACVRCALTGVIGPHALDWHWPPVAWMKLLCGYSQGVGGTRRVLQEIHETFPGQLSQHSEQTHGNVTWLAVAKGRMEDVMRLLDQAAACGWTPRPALLSVGGSPSACEATLRSVLACARAPQSAEGSGFSRADVRVAC